MNTQPLLHTGVGSPTDDNGREARIPTGRIISASRGPAASRAIPAAQEPRVESAHLKAAQRPYAFYKSLIGASIFTAAAAYSMSAPLTPANDDVIAAATSQPRAKNESVMRQARSVAAQYRTAELSRVVYQPEPEVRQRKLAAPVAKAPARLAAEKPVAPLVVPTKYNPPLPKASQKALVQRVEKIISYHSPKHANPRVLAERIVRESAAQGYDPLFVAAVIKSESGFNSLARSHVGARGLMQIMPKTGQYLAEKHNMKKVQLYDTDQNLRLGISFLKELEAGYNGDKVMTLVAYNWGPGHVMSAGKGKRRIPGEVVRYAVRILNDYRRWRGEVPASPTALG